jgi:hypothetical protein
MHNTYLCVHFGQPQLSQGLQAVTQLGPAQTPKAGHHVRQEGTQQLRTRLLIQRTNAAQQRHTIGICIARKNA